jgi:hypothetical protein
MVRPYWFLQGMLQLNDLPNVARNHGARNLSPYLDALGLKNVLLFA